MRILHKSHNRHIRRLKVGDRVKVATSLRGLAHPDYRKVFRRVAGRVTIVVGWDATGGAWIPIQGCEVLTIEPHLLRVVRRGKRKHARHNAAA
jgi:hypothetical protein